VQEWFDTRTFTAGRWGAEQLVDAKGGQQVAVVLPARNEESTVGHIVSAIRHSLVDRIGLVDDVVVIDSRSTDGTATVAERAGARVFNADQILAWLGPRDGKGEAMWKSLAVTKADLLVFVDADLRSFSPAYVTGLLGPLLTLPEVVLVKAAYDRRLVLGGEPGTDGGGRVTEFTARPMLNALWPDLAGLLQPLAGEYAARRSALEQVPFACGYGVEIALLLDVYARFGLKAFAQVDLGARTHRNRPDADLVAMASAVLQAAMRRLPSDLDIARTVTRFERLEAAFAPVTVDVLDDERPPFASLEVVLADTLAS
jgi:glucosyl-3-phosphoglycerate synthase